KAGTILSRDREGAVSAASYQARQPPGAVANAVLVNAIQLENAQQKIPARNCLGRIRQVTVPLELPGCATDQNMRHVVVQVLVGVTHIAAVENQRMIEQRTITVRGPL